ncbi:MAG: hypothetical protein OXC63_08205 [Aestuariivita sp.]|nr:hypothetical protein [Aestuariivita sp.]MCY4345373.1 hypothetical protein [Aestuariivita sp.]
MNDPHVVALIYQIDHSDGIDYSKAEPLTYAGDGFRLSVADGSARFDLEDHFSTIEAADEALTNFRAQWEFSAQLDRGPETFRLKLDRNASEIIDRNPPPNAVYIRGIGVSLVTFSAKLQIGAPAYPSPTTSVALTPDVKTMFDRYMGYKKGQEPLAGMANFCLTVLQYTNGPSRGSRSRAAKMYTIDRMVLDKIGELSANCGGAEARKAVGLTREFTNEEKYFVEKAVKALIWRMAEKAHSPDKQLSCISFANLPPLTSGEGKPADR